MAGAGPSIRRFSVEVAKYKAGRPAGIPCRPRWTSISLSDPITGREFLTDLLNKLQPPLPPAETAVIVEMLCYPMGVENDCTAFIDDELAGVLVDVGTQRIKFNLQAPADHVPPNALIRLMAASHSPAYPAKKLLPPDRQPHGDDELFNRVVDYLQEHDLSWQGEAAAGTTGLKFVTLLCKAFFPLSQYVLQQLLTTYRLPEETGAEFGDWFGCKALVHTADRPSSYLLTAEVAMSDALSTDSAWLGRLGQRVTFRDKLNILREKITAYRAALDYQLKENAVVRSAESAMRTFSNAMHCELIVPARGTKPLPDVLKALSHALANSPLHVRIDLNDFMGDMSKQQRNTFVLELKKVLPLVNM
jgi:hypothetical protein